VLQEVELSDLRCPAPLTVGHLDRGSREGGLFSCDISAPEKEVIKTGDSGCSLYH
jgi:hypothetical protein